MLGAIRIPSFVRKPLLDVRLGFALMRSLRVPVRSKLLAVLIGLAVTGLVELLEIPVEGLLSMLLPVLGAVGDVVVDGAEIVAGPILLAAILLPFLAPHDVVEEIRSERSRSGRAPKNPIIDIT